MKARQEDIHEAYPKTFQWLLVSENHIGKPGGDFINWLEADSGMYWINGKPGSGKSTVRLSRQLLLRRRPSLLTPKSS